MWSASNDPLELLVSGEEAYHFSCPKLIAMSSAKGATVGKGTECFQEPVSETQSLKDGAGQDRRTQGTGRNWALNPGSSSL
jgi:hypothetical protein